MSEKPFTPDEIRNIFGDSNEGDTLTIEEEINEKTGENDSELPPIKTNPPGAEVFEGDSMRWLDLAHERGYGDVVGIFESGKCKICAAEGNDNNGHKPFPVMYINRNNLRDQLNHLEQNHRSLVE